MTSEPILDEIRRVRHVISERIGHDPRRIVSYYADLQRQHRDRLIDLSGEFDLHQSEVLADQPRTPENTELLKDEL